MSACEREGTVNEILDTPLRGSKQGVTPKALPQSHSVKTRNVTLAKGGGSIQ